MDITETKMKPARAWCGTLNNYSDIERELLEDADCVYSIIGRETGVLGETEHLQMYFYFSTMKSLKQMKKLNERAHWEVAKGNTLHNYTYCSKDGLFTEKGTRPLTQEEKGVLGKRAYEEAWDLAKSGKIEEIDAGIRVRLYSSLKRIEKDYQPKPVMVDELKGLWFWGPTGCGKSKSAGVGKEGVFRKDANNKWWDYYEGEEIVVIDELMPKHAVEMGYYLKIWGDHYPFIAEKKGGGMMARPKLCVVTSQYSISALFDDRETIEALRRRYKEVQFGVDEVPLVAVAPPPRPIIAECPLGFEDDDDDEEIPVNRNRGSWKKGVTKNFEYIMNNNQ